MLFRTLSKNLALPASTSFTYGTKYGEANDLEMGFLFDGNFLENQNIIKSVWIDTMPTMTQMMMAL